VLPRGSCGGCWSSTVRTGGAALVVGRAAVMGPCSIWNAGKLLLAAGGAPLGNCAASLSLLVVAAGGSGCRLAPPLSSVLSCAALSNASQSAPSSPAPRCIFSTQGMGGQHSSLICEF